MTTKVDWIKSQLLPDETASAATSRLNTALTIENPSPQLAVSVPVDVDKLWDIVPPIEVFKVLNTLLWDRVVRAIESGNNALVGRYVSALVAGGCLTPTTAGKLAGALSGQVPDPSWSRTVVTTPALAAGWPPVTVGEVQDALLEVSNVA